ncbi:helix-turn-helix domain-containing protein [bacterium]|nr:helix-turn-helix domain-containing protein [bacterium]
MHDGEGLIDLADAARRLGTGKHTVRKLIRSGELRAFKVRSVIRIAPLDLRRYLQRHEIAEADSSHNDDRRVG